MCMSMCPCVQWAVVGDTFPVGCRFQNAIVFRDNSFTDNPDERNPLYKSVLPIYTNDLINELISNADSLPPCNVRVVFPFQALNTGSTNQTVASRTSPCRGATMVRDAFRITPLTRESTSQSKKKQNQHCILNLAVFFFQSTSTKS